MMHIGKTAKLAHLTVDTIRFYERQALLGTPSRTEGRFRLFTSEDVRRLEFIRRMQALGFSLREIRQLLDLRDQRDDACPRVRDLLVKKLGTVRARMRDWAALERQLSADLKQCNRELRRRHEPRTCPVLNGNRTAYVH